MKSKTGKAQAVGTLEHSGQGKCPLDRHLLHDNEFIFDFPTEECSSKGPKLNMLPCLSDPDPMQFEHAINFRSPHLLHIPNELNIRAHVRYL